MECRCHGNGKSFQPVDSGRQLAVPARSELPWQQPPVTKSASVSLSPRCIVVRLTTQTDVATIVCGRVCEKTVMVIKKKRHL